MSKIGDLITGAGIATRFTGLAQIDSDLIVGDVDTTCPLRGIKVSVGSKTTIDIQESQPLVDTFFKFMRRMAGSVVGLGAKISTGRVEVPGCSIVLVNDGVTTPPIFNFSKKSKGVPISAETVGINALGNNTFSNFAGLFINPIANLGSCDVTFEDGTQQNMVAAEIDALFNETNATEANGKLNAAVSGFDNRDRSIKSVKVNATTALTVMIIS